jgi:hypothetical protein
MNLSDMLDHKQSAEGPRTGFMNMRDLQPTDRVSENLVSHGPQYERGIDHLIQGLVDLLPKSNGIWPLHERAKWLRLAAGIFDLGYKAGDGEHADINIAVIKQVVANRPLSPSIARTTAREQINHD